MGRVLNDPPEKMALMDRAQKFSLDSSGNQFEHLILDLVRERRARQAL